MLSIDMPPQVILPDHYVHSRPSIIRSGLDLSTYFPVDLDIKSKKQIIAELTRHNLIDDKKVVEAAIPFGVFKPRAITRTAAFQGTFTTTIGTPTARQALFASVPLGTARSTRIVQAWFSFNAKGVIESATIGGNAATLTEHFGSATLRWASIRASVPSGTSADIIVTVTPTTTASASLLVFTSDSNSGTEANSYDYRTINGGTSASGTSNITINSINAVAGGTLFFCQYSDTTALTTTQSWTGPETVVESYDDTTNARRYSVGFIELTASNASRSMTLTPSTSSTRNAVINVFGSPL